MKDRFFCINMTKDIDKRRTAWAEFDRIGITVHRMCGVIAPSTGGGCRMSHQKIVQMAKRNHWPYVTVFEDDVEFVNGWEHVLRGFEQLPSDWELYYLGIRPKKKLIRHSDNLMYVRRGHTTHAICYHERIYDMILDNEEPRILGMDDFVCETVQPRGRSYVVFPMVASQVGRNILKKYKGRIKGA